ncbi:MAG: TolC family protein, partial [Planctomycetaceae bacterium]
MMARSPRAAVLTALMMATACSCANPSSRPAAARISGQSVVASSAPVEEGWIAGPPACSPVADSATDGVSLTAFQDEASVEAGPPIAPAAPEAADEPAPVPPLDGQISPEFAEGGLTLAALEQMALANNPTLRQAQNRVRKAEGNRIQVGLYPNPTVGYLSEEIGDDDTAGKQGGFVQQTIVTADKLDWNRAVASQDVEQARWQFDAQQLRVLTDVRVRSIEVLGAQRTVAILERLEDIAEAGVTTAQE